MNESAKGNVQATLDRLGTNLIEANADGTFSAGGDAPTTDVLALPREELLSGFETGFLVAAGIALLAAVFVLAALVADRRARKQS